MRARWLSVKVLARLPSALQCPSATKHVALAGFTPPLASKTALYSVSLSSPHGLDTIPTSYSSVGRAKARKALSRLKALAWILEVRQTC